MEIFLVNAYPPSAIIKLFSKICHQLKSVLLSLYTFHNMSHGLYQFFLNLQNSKRYFLASRKTACEFQVARMLSLSHACRCICENEHWDPYGCLQQIVSLDRSGHLLSPDIIGWFSHHYLLALSAGLECRPGGRREPSLSLRCESVFYVKA